MADEVIGYELEDSVPELQPGATVSLDMRRRQFLEVEGLVLTPDSPSARIPMDISAQGMRMLQKCYNRGDVVLRPAAIMPSVSSSSLQHFFNAIDKAETCDDFRNEMFRLMRSPNGMVGNMPIHEVLLQIGIHEARTRCRPQMINYIGGARAGMAIPREEQEPPLIVRVNIAARPKGREKTETTQLKTDLRPEIAEMI